MHAVCCFRNRTYGESYGIAGDGVCHRRRDPDHSVKDRQQGDCDSEAHVEAGTRRTSRNSQCDGQEQRAKVRFVTLSAVKARLVRHHYGPRPRISWRIIRRSRGLGSLFRLSTKKTAFLNTSFWFSTALWPANLSPYTAMTPHLG